MYCLIETQVWSTVVIKKQQQLHVIAAAKWWPAKNRSNCKSRIILIVVGFAVGVGAAHWQDAPLLLLLHPLINSCELNSTHHKQHLLSFPPLLITAVNKIQTPYFLCLHKAILSPLSITVVSKILTSPPPLKDTCELIWTSISVSNPSQKKHTLYL